MDLNSCKKLSGNLVHRSATCQGTHAHNAYRELCFTTLLEQIAYQLSYIRVVWDARSLPLKVWKPLVEASYSTNGPRAVALRRRAFPICEVLAHPCLTTLVFIRFTMSVNVFWNLLTLGWHSKITPLQLRSCWRLLWDASPNIDHPPGSVSHLGT